MIACGLLCLVYIAWCCRLLIAWFCGLCDLTVLCLLGVLVSFGCAAGITFGVFSLGGIWLVFIVVWL